MKYRGCFYEGKRFGRGVLYDRNGLVEYDGLWKNGESYSNQHDNNIIDNTTESVDIHYNSYNNENTLILPFFLCSLKRIVVREGCFRMVRVFELNGLDELESVEIGQDSFRISRYKERNDGSCRIVNCPILKSIQIGDSSFDDYHSFELNNLPSLQTIDIGHRCLYYAPSFSLAGLIDGLV